ncbi:hypothetical protein L1987_16731 [Smallanthus sonchifolius]|uniref:Uncharacterized protein n=1 Tax=Smallanthus sonchifolius TaxID=185202 RepID=A0ACB9IXF8_9ASTR|nr:hypothetical protein L1987_16731 [Smallanthus sonchifolius]
MAFLRTAMMITNLNSKLYRASACNHGISTLPAPLDSPISQSAASQPLISPELERRVDTFDYRFVSDFPFYVNNGSMELMAVPKKKTSPHKRGIRNGPKALKPIPVIIRCKVCGRVKLPHFFCCSGLRDTDAPNGSTS